MSERRVLVAGIGNVFFGDDGFGVEVARRLRARLQPAGVDVVDFGIRGLDLTYALLDGYDAAILIDAVPRDGVPGTLYVIEPEIESSTEPSIDTHGMDPMKVLKLASAIGGRLPILRVVGCEPAALAEVGEMAMGLSTAVAASAAEAVRLVETLVAELREGVSARA